MTSTAATVEAAWLTPIWQSATVSAITPNVFTYEVTQGSVSEVKIFYFGKEINFIQALTFRNVEHRLLGQKNYTFTVQVSYFRHKGTKGDNWTEVRNFFDTLYALVVSGLSPTWTGTVDFWRPQEGPAEITETTLDNESVWKGTYTFTGFQAI